MAIACFLLVTFLPLRPDLSLPFFIARISLSTLFPAAGEYFRPEDFFAGDFFALPLFLLLLLFAVPLLDELLFFARLDFFVVDFVAAMSILHENQMSGLFESVARCCRLDLDCDLPMNYICAPTQRVALRAGAQEDRRPASTQHTRMRR